MFVAVMRGPAVASVAVVVVNVLLRSLRVMLPLVCSVEVCRGVMMQQRAVHCIARVLDTETISAKGV